MDQPSQSVCDLARQLVASGQNVAGPQSHAVVHVSEKLRSCLGHFAGSDGFASLMRRALAIASREVPSLSGVTVSQDGHLEGMEQAAEKGTLGREEANVIARALLGLLVTFVGEPLTLKLVRDSCIENTSDKLDSRSEAADDRS